jgi:hypothetical protein
VPTKYEILSVTLMTDYYAAAALHSICCMILELVYCLDLGSQNYCFLWKERLAEGLIL